MRSLRRPLTRPVWPPRNHHRRRHRPRHLPTEEAAPTTTTLTGHNVVVGYGRVGSRVGAGLRAAGRPLFVVEESKEGIEVAQRDGAEVVIGNAADPEVLAAANLPAAKRLFVTIPEAFEAGQVVEQARAANPDLEILARAHSDAEIEHFTNSGRYHDRHGRAGDRRPHAGAPPGEWGCRDRRARSSKPQVLNRPVSL